MSCEAPTFVPGFEGAEPCHSAVLDMVFIHGLNGDRYTTWSATEENFWLTWLAKRFPTCNVYTAGYDTQLFYNLLTGPGASIQDIATVLADSLASRANPAPAILFVTHSLGGLVVKQMVRKCADSADPDFNEVARSVRGIAFLATPHQGARFAEAINIILTRFSAKVVKQLAYSADALIDLHEFFRTWATKNHVLVKPYYETNHTWGVHVVDKVTANPNVYGADPIAVQADHLGICKPVSESAPVYLSIIKLIETIIGKAGPGAAVPTGGDLVATDRSEAISFKGTALIPVSSTSSVARLPTTSTPISDSIATGSMVTFQGAQNEVGIEPDGIAPDILADYQFFTTVADKDRRDLARKLLDVGRSYQVDDAERKKERFNMALRRNIAQPAAVTRYTRLMADVESRFHRHISRLIAAGADVVAIDEAIQQNIVSPCATTHSIRGGEISASLVDSALYYLAGNCHIRWDDGAA